MATTYNLTSIVSIDGNKYAVVQDTYSKIWERWFNSDANLGFIRITTTDRGPGTLIYKMQLHIETWPTNSQPYLAGVTQDFTTQLNNLETTYLKKAKAISFIDPFGNFPTIPTGNPNAGTQDGVYFVTYTLNIPKWATPGKQAAFVLVELKQSGSGVTI